MTLSASEATDRHRDAIREATEAIALVPAPDDPRLYDVYLQRARARYALGVDAELVRRDLEATGRCAASQGGVRLLKFEANRVKVRRLEPLHLALLVPEPPLVERCGEAFGLPLLAYFARTASNDVVTEVRALSSAFRGPSVDTPADLLGLAVGTYSAVLGQLAAGDKKAASALLTRYDRAVDSCELTPPAPALRYLYGVECLAAIARRDSPGVALALGRVAARATADDAPDLMALGLLGLSTLETLDVSPEAFGAHAGPLASAVLRAWAEVD